MRLKKAKTPRRSSKKKQVSVKRAMSKRRGSSRVSVRRGDRSSRSAKRSKSSRRSIRGGGKVGKIALGTGILAIGGTYAAAAYYTKEIKKWYKEIFKKTDNEKIKTVINESLAENNVLNDSLADDVVKLFEKLPHQMNDQVFTKFRTALKGFNPVTSSLEENKEIFTQKIKKAVQPVGSVQRRLSSDNRSISTNAVADADADGGEGDGNSNVIAVADGIAADGTVRGGGGSQSAPSRSGAAAVAATTGSTGRSSASSGGEGGGGGATLTASTLKFNSKEEEILYLVMVLLFLKHK